MTSIAPGSASRIGNRHYKTDEEFLFACADAMREEYKAIVDAGLILQLDDPAIATTGTWSIPSHGRRLQEIHDGPDRGAQPRAPRPARRTASVFICAGAAGTARISPTSPMRDIVDVMLAVNAQAYSFEAGNVRHEHEWKVWQDVKLPDDKIILPGIVSHATNVVEHPELVADRICASPNRRPRARHRLDRLRARRPHPSADRLGEARSAGARRRARQPTSSGVKGPLGSENDYRLGQQKRRPPLLPWLLETCLRARLICSGPFSPSAIGHCSGADHIGRHAGSL